jgi:predicted enzyme related to lactoylglutathione lyase
MHVERVFWKRRHKMQAIWVEFPVKDLERAMKFYQVVFDLQPTEIMADDVRRTTTLVSGTGEGVAGVSLNQTKHFAPGDKGVLVYLDAGEDLTNSLNRVEAAGGKIIEPKTSMGAAGNYATVLDTEGNQFALYSYK